MLYVLFHPYSDDKDSDKTEHCYYIDTRGRLSRRSLTVITSRIGRPYGPPVTTSTAFPGLRVLEVGPRISIETSYSSTAVAALHAIGVTNVRRVERSTRTVYRDDEERARLEGLIDPLLEEIYPNTLKTLTVKHTPQPVRTYPVLQEGREAIARANKELGLGMDERDIDYYTEMFQGLGRNPTDVELLQIGNGNSDHSRHHVFSAQWIIDNLAMPHTLLELVKAPFMEARDTDSVTLAAFNDNVGIFSRYPGHLFVPGSPDGPAPYECIETEMAITHTAETHNHPTGVAPYPGAATGGGGEIRDSTAGGRGSFPVAGFAGYCVGNLFLPGHHIPGENVGGEDVFGRASSIKVLVEGSSGIHGYANPFGRPTIGGFTRSFEQEGVYGERRGWRKPILYSGGQGDIPVVGVKKEPATKEMLVVVIGGPVFPVGLGGASASSVAAGTNSQKLDLASVQRGNPEMERKTNEVIYRCIALLEKNPIAAIHDSGAGGTGNVLTELVAASGGRLNIREINLGDKTMSVLVIWSAEAQERYGLLIWPENLSLFQRICEREVVGCEVIGKVTGDGQIQVYDGENPEPVVDLSLSAILGEIPQKVFESSTRTDRLPAFVPPENLDFGKVVEGILLRPEVCSKAFLTHNADRSVGGRVVQQQECGPAQLPVADAAVTACGFEGFHGVVTAIGEQPIKLLANPEAGARMSIGETVTNMAGVVTGGIETIRCRVNYMGPAKHPHEGACLYDAYTALKEMLLPNGIVATGGKDSSSMDFLILEEIIKGLHTLVIMGTAFVPDITQVVTPDIKHKGRSALGYIDLGKGQNRLGGSAFAVSLGEVGNNVPNVDDVDLLRRAFAAVQEGVREGYIVALHDRSDGGLITTLIEMCLSGVAGAQIEYDVEDHVATWLCEELGWLLEYAHADEEHVRSLFTKHDVPFVRIGVTSEELRLRVSSRGNMFFDESLATLRQRYEATSLRIKEERGQAEEDIGAERTLYASTPLVPKPHLTFTPRPIIPGPVINAAVLRVEGINGHVEMAAALRAAGFRVWDVTKSDLRTGKISLEQFQLIAMPGGFSFMDTFGAARGWAAVINENKRVRREFDAFLAREDTLSFGVCNGCQLMPQIGVVPYPNLATPLRPDFLKNHSGLFESRWVYLRIVESPAVALREMEGSVIGAWVAHQEGRAFFPDMDVLRNVQSDKLIPLVYANGMGEATEDYPWNPNGSPQGIAALCDPTGRHLAMMPHIERAFKLWQMPWVPPSWKKELPESPWMQAFHNMHAWCVQHTT